MATVAIVGGGYGGIAAAKLLDEVADVVLVEPRDAFVHNVAALRALVDPLWTDQIFLPYGGLLRRGRIVSDRAVRVSPGLVLLGSGERIRAEHIVLATGSTYPFPAKVAEPDGAVARAAFATMRSALALARRVVLLGAGPVGLELAGEIVAAWPDKAVTVVDPAADVVSGGYPDALRAELRDQLATLGVRLVLGSALTAPPPTEPGELGRFTAVTADGREVSGDLWLRCFGGAPVSDYLDDELAAARDDRGHLAVTDELRLPGQDAVYAIGDLTAIDEPKMAKAAADHAAAVAATITAAITGAGAPVRYHPGAPGIAVPLGPTGGASYTDRHGLLGPADTARVKGSHLRLDAVRELLNFTPSR